MAIESKNLLVWVKAMSRGQALPLDASEVYGSYAEAETYAGSATAYAGQTIKALMEDGKYHSYTLQPSEAGYVLEEVGAIKASDLKQYVMVVDALPETGMEQGILYICDTTGSIWTGSEWKEVFWDASVEVDKMGERVDAVEEALDEKAPIANPVFTGVVKVGEEEVALQSYVDGLFANLEESCATPEIVNSENPLPVEYKAGKTYRVAEAGVYAGEQCEVGDLILVVKDYVEGSASDEDLIVLQANIDGAVTSTAEVSTVGEIVVFDAVTGKVIKGSGVQIASLNDAIAKAHEHANKTQLDTFDKTQEELLAAAKAEAEGLVAAHQTTMEEALAGKADKATTLAGYGITDAYTSTVIDGKLQTITENLNTKASTTDVDNKIATAKSEAISEAATDASEALAAKVGEIGDGVTVKEYVDTAKQNAIDSASSAASTALEARVGSIPADTTIQSYIDTAVGSGGTASAQAIATAKQEAIDASKSYTDAQILAHDTTAKAYIDQQDGVTLDSAKGYVDTQIAAALTVTEF